MQIWKALFDLGSSSAAIFAGVEQLPEINILRAPPVSSLNDNNL
jgi:hypothetical protein